MTLSDSEGEGSLEDVGEPDGVLERLAEIARD
jgi:hypothetical protein